MQLFLVMEGNRTYLIYFIEQQNMTYFPSQLQQPQVLWQPVVVQPYKDQTIEQLRRENQFLKHQLSQVLKINQCIPNFQHQHNLNCQPTDRQSFYPEKQCCTTRRQSKNACYSPRLQTNTNRLSFNRSPGPRGYLSPNQLNQNRQPLMNTKDESTKIKRMAISKGKDGKYYRDVFKENEHSDINVTHETINKFSTAENSLIFSGWATPTARNKEMNEMFASSIHHKTTTNRLKSPSFLKKRINHESEENDRNRTSLLTHLKNQLAMGQSQPLFKRSHEVQQSILESEQTIKQIKQQPIDDRSQVEVLKSSKVQRHECRVPTLQLSYECDSNLSIQRMLRQFKRQQKKKQTKFSNCDHFLKEIAQNLDAMYGKEQSK